MTFKRYRFTTKEADYRPVKFPPPGPWWCTGYDSSDNAILVCYLPSKVDLKEYWPEAENIDYTEEEQIVYTSRFPKPKWYDPPLDEQGRVLVE